DRGRSHGRIQESLRGGNKHGYHGNQGLCVELESKMKLVTFQIGTPLGPFLRVGALHGPHVIDLNMAYVRWLSDQGEAQPHRLADGQVPASMLAFLEGGASTMGAARRALDYVSSLGPSPQGPCAETIVHALTTVTLAAPLPNPPSLRDFIAFEDHIAATSKKR